MIAGFDCRRERLGALCYHFKIGIRLWVRIAEDTLICAGHHARRLEPDAPFGGSRNKDG